MTKLTIEDFNTQIGKLPKTRGDCPKDRPCPNIYCKHHLYQIFMTPRKGYKPPNIELEDMVETCLLDCTDNGPMDYTQIAKALNMTPEGVKLVEESALKKLRPLMEDYRFMIYD